MVEPLLKVSAFIYIYWLFVVKYMLLMGRIFFFFFITKNMPFWQKNKYTFYQKSHPTGWSSGRTEVFSLSSIECFNVWLTLIFTPFVKTNEKVKRIENVERIEKHNEKNVSTMINDKKNDKANAKSIIFCILIFTLFGRKNEKVKKTKNIEGIEKCQERW